MPSFLLIYRGSLTKVIEITELSQVAQAKKMFYLRGYGVKDVCKPPSERTLRRWTASGKAKAVDGCETTGLESCSHGCNSWLWVNQKVKQWKHKKKSVAVTGAVGKTVAGPAQKKKLVVLPVMQNTESLSLVTDAVNVVS
jgi:hypothetical protein